LRAAARLYAVRGFDGTSMRHIAEAAGVTKPLIF
jgi:AcrR family transcriptional regulator